MVYDKIKDLPAYNKKANEILKNSVKIINDIEDKCKDKEYEEVFIEPPYYVKGQEQVKSKHIELDDDLHVYIWESKGEHNIYIADKCYGKDNMALYEMISNKVNYDISLGAGDNGMQLFSSTMSGKIDGENFWMQRGKKAFLKDEDQDIFDLTEVWIEDAGADDKKEYSRNKLKQFRKKIQKIISREEIGIPESSKHTYDEER